MGLLESTTHREYYQNNTFGGYQFTSLDDIITQFQIAYVGEDKIISKTKRADIAFHAQRALQELSFDTLKSIKSYQIELPPSLVMPLPHDYVNYTKITWVDSAGVEHPLYHTSRTSNPFQIRQEEDGTYAFQEEVELIVNGDFSEANANNKPPAPWNRNSSPTHSSNLVADMNITDEVLKFSHRTRSSHGETNWGHAIAIWQEIDVSDQDYIDISANGTAVNMTNGVGVLRFGVSTGPGDVNSKNITGVQASPTYNTDTTIFDLTNVNDVSSYLEWTAEDTGSKELLQVDVRSHDIVYALAVSYMDFSDINETLTVTNYIDDLSIEDSYASVSLSGKIGNERESSTWNSYTSATPSENNNDDYEDDTYWPVNGERYGLDPQHAQANGSFFIDPRLGRIHFSSNVSGKNVILDYISDSLGTDAEMQVHKFAEEAMYKCIAYAIISTKINVPGQVVQRFKKEKFAEVRKAKLRLSNIKLEELTQTLRGKSKHIKH